jgi:hypothetical protein
MSDASPWDGISEPRGDYTVRAAHTGKAAPAFWARDAGGKCLYIIELEGDYRERFLKERLQVKGLETDLRTGDRTGTQHLVLALRQDVDRDLFASMCRTLGSALLAAAGPDDGFRAAVEHLHRWRAFFSGKQVRLLSHEELRGLFAELHVLRWIYGAYRGKADAVEGWCGPDQAHHDFVFDELALEVKSLIARDRNTVRISSEDQLEKDVGTLFLFTVFLSAAGGGPSQSVNALVALMEEELASSSALGEFRLKLARAGYVRLDDYDQPGFAVIDMKAYRVADDMPRIVRSELPAGVSRVQYQIALESLAPYACDPTTAFGATP